MKNNRQQKILELIATYPIGTQDELISYLKQSDYNATQATVSRDIRALKLVKAMSEDGSYRYTLPQKGVQDGSRQQAGASYRKGFADSIVSVAWAMNNVVVKTTPGMASAVALFLDQTYHDMMLGSVAGDDTIIVVTRSSEDSEKMSRLIEDPSV